MQQYLHPFFFGGGGYSHDLPVLVELRVQVLVLRMKEPNEVRRLTDPWVAAQKLVAVCLQELEAVKILGGALLPFAAILHLLI